MGPFLLLAALCVVLGFGIGWLVARFLSRALLRALWLGLAITFVWILWPAVPFWMGWREATAYEGVAEIVLSFVFVLPTLITSLLGGWLGLRQKARSQVE